MTVTRHASFAIAGLLAVAASFAPRVVMEASAGMPVAYAPHSGVARAIAVGHGEAQLRAVRTEGHVVARNGVAAHERLRRGTSSAPTGPEPVAHRESVAGAMPVNAQVRGGRDLRRLSHAPSLGTSTAVTRAQHVRWHSIAVVRAHAVAGIAVFHDALAPPSTL